MMGMKVDLKKQAGKVVAKKGKCKHRITSSKALQTSKNSNQI